jgi:hypothetical protein
MNKAQLHSATSSGAAAFFSSMAKKARFSPALLTLALFLIFFSFLYGVDLRELIARQAQEASRLIVNTNSSNAVQNEKEQPAGKHAWQLSVLVDWFHFHPVIAG